MINVIGVGHAFPDTVLSADLLQQIGSVGEPPVASGVLERRTSLQSDYLLETGNENPRLAETNAAVTPTQLGFQAAQLALQRAGIEPDDLGLIFGSCSTPLETCPSEAQRIGALLQVKIPAYDVTASSADLALHLTALSQWKNDRIPKYVLCVSTNLPTQRVNYRNDPSGYLFGDGAFAMVVSMSEQGKARVLDSCFESSVDQIQLLTFDLYESARVQVNELAEWCDEKMLRMADQAVKKNSLKTETLLVIGNQFGLQGQLKVAEHLSIPADQSWSNAERLGCSLGAAPGVALSEQWDQLARGQTALCLVAGGGGGSGYVVMEVV